MKSFSQFLQESYLNEEEARQLRLMKRDDKTPYKLNKPSGSREFASDPTPTPASRRLSAATPEASKPSPGQLEIPEPKTTKVPGSQFRNAGEARQGSFFTRSGRPQNFTGGRTPFVATDPVKGTEKLPAGPETPKISPGQMEIDFNARSNSGNKGPVRPSIGNVSGPASSPKKPAPANPSTSSSYRNVGVGRDGPVRPSIGNVSGPASSPKKPAPANPSTSSSYRNVGVGRDTFRAQSAQPQQQTPKRSNPNIPTRNPGESREAYAQRRMQATQQRKSGKTSSSSAIVPASRTSSSAIVPASNQPGKPPAGAKPSTWSKIGKWGGRAFTALDAASNVADEKAKGSGWVRSLAKGAAVTAGGLAGGALGAIGGGGVGSFALGTAGSIGGAEAAGRAFDTVAGANARERKAMAQANRQRQAGTAIKGIGGKTTFSQTKPGGPAFMSTGVGKQRKTVQLAKTGVVQRGGQSVAGHLAFKGGKAVYKAGPSAQSLAKTSSNPLERIGRSLFAGAYKKHDTMKAQQALTKARQSDAARNKALGVKALPGK